MCVDMCLCVFMRVFVWICLDEYMYMCMDVGLCVFMCGFFVRLYVLASVCVFVSVCLGVFAYACGHVHV